MSILSGRRRTGGGSPTLHDVARAAGVSPMTVSRVLANVETVNEAMRMRVQAVIDEIRYSPNPLARSLARTGSSKIGIVQGNPSTMFASQLLVSLFEASSRFGIQLVLARCDHLDMRESAVSTMIAASVNAVILPTPLADDDALRDRFESQGIPTLALGTGRQDSSGASIWVNNEAAAAEMTRHLIGLGHSDIAFIRGPANSLDAQQRYKGFKSAMRDAGLAVPRHRVAVGDYTYRSGMAAADRLLSTASPPTALFASNDEMAAGALAAAHRKHVDVPDRLSIAGFDDTPLATTIWPALTTVRQPIDILVERGMQMLMERMAPGPCKIPMRESVALSLIARDSTAPLSPRA